MSKVQVAFLKMLARYNPDSNQFLHSFILTLPLFSATASVEEERQIQNTAVEELV